MPNRQSTSMQLYYFVFHYLLLSFYHLYSVAFQVSDGYRNTLTRSSKFRSKTLSAPYTRKSDKRQFVGVFCKNYMDLQRSCA